ncbi:MAG: hypothetical protein ACOCVF_00505 [bacterium]
MANIGDINKDLAASRKYYEEINRLLEEEKGQLSNIFNIRRKMAINSEIIANNQKISNDLEKKTNELISKGEKIHGNTLNAVAKQRAELYKQNKALEIKLRNKKRILNISNNILSTATNLVSSLSAQDKIIKQTILSLAMSGQKAELVRSTFEDAAMEVSFLGSNLGEVQAIMVGYADATGRARTLTSQMVVDITEIGKGTGIGVQRAASLVGKFEIIGVSANKAKSIVQDMVTEGEKFGINTTRAIENLEANFKSLNAMTFKGGVKAMGNMALYAEQMKVDMQASIASANAVRFLDKSIELAAQLQVMGGQFAKVDPLEMLFLSRNAPDRFQKKVAEMTQGVVTLRKTADGTFEKFISPVDIDRLRIAGEALGRTKEEMVEMAQRQFDMGKMSNQLFGRGLTKEQQEIIKGAAIFDSETGKYMVRVGERLKSITEMTAQDVRAYEQQEKTLAERAKLAQDFETALQQTILGFKSVMLPALRGVNRVLETARPFVEKVGNFIDTITKSDIGNKLMIAGGVLFGAAKLLNATLAGFTKSTLAQFIRGKAGKGMPAWSTVPPKTDIGRQVTPAKGAGRGAGMLKGGAGIGAAGLGVGAGIGAAALGISQLAQAVKDVDVEKLQIMNQTLMGLGAGMAMFIGAAAGISFLGTAAAPALYAVGGAVALIGAGVGIAAAGIGRMGEGLATLVDASKDAGPAMLQVGAGVAAINATMGIGAVGGLLGGFRNFKKMVTLISDEAPGIERVGTAFENIKAVMTGNKDDFEEIRNVIKDIANTNVAKNSVFAELKDLLQNPLQVEFADDAKARLVSDITLEIDGERFMNKIYNHKIAVQKQVSLAKQKGT